MKFNVENKKGFDSFAKQQSQKLRDALLAAMTRVIDEGKARARASVASGGFGQRWQNAIRTKVYPNAGQPTGPAGLVYHKIQYSSVFEQGATVAGKPILWLPLKGVPLGRGSHPLTPKQYVERIGPLKAVNRGGKPPLLIGRGTRRTISRATRSVVRVRRSALKTGSIKGGWEPLYVGVPRVVDPKRFDIRAAVKQAADKLDRYFFEAYVKRGANDG